jgi:hypothetical protein
VKNIIFFIHILKLIEFSRPTPYTGTIRDGKRIPISDPHNYTAEWLREKKIRKSAIILRLWIDPSAAVNSMNLLLIKIFN